MTDNLCILYAGGTFGSIGEPLSPLAGTAFLKVLQQTVSNTAAVRTSNNLHITYQSLPTKDSSQFDAQDFFAIYQHIKTSTKQGIERVILITGTDTLSYLANFLAVGFALNDITLTLLASMQPLLTTYPHQHPAQASGYTPNPNSDAFNNLNLALNHTLKSHSARGVWVACSGHVQPAASTQKLHSTATQAFLSPFCWFEQRKTQDLQKPQKPQNKIKSAPTNHTTGYQNLAKQLNLGLSAAAASPQPASKPAALSNIVNSIRPAHIACFYALPIQKDELNIQLSALVAQKPDAIILAAFGTGNFPYSEHLAHTLAQAHDNHTLVILSTQVAFGGVQAGYAAGAWLSEQHVLSGGEASLPSIYAQLLWLCSLEQHYPTRRAIWSSTIWY